MAGMTSGHRARSGGMEIRSVNSATGPGNDLRRLEGSADTSEHQEFTEIARNSAGSPPTTGRDGQMRLRQCLAKTGKRVAKIGQTVAKMKNPTVATRRTRAGTR